MFSSSKLGFISSAPVMLQRYLKQFHKVICTSAAVGISIRRPPARYVDDKCPGAASSPAAASAMSMPP